MHEAPSDPHTSPLVPLFAALGLLAVIVALPTRHALGAGVIRLIAAPGTATAAMMPPFEYIRLQRVVTVATGHTSGSTLIALRNRASSRVIFSRPIGSGGSDVM